MSDVIILVRVVCLAIALFGTMLALTAERNGNPVPIIIGIIIFAVSMMGVYALGEPYTEALKKETESGTEYKAVYQDEIKSFVDCYKENGFNVCETKDGKKMVVEHYWKKDESKKKKEKQPLKYKGVKNSEIKKYVLNHCDSITIRTFAME